MQEVAAVNPFDAAMQSMMWGFPLLRNLLATCATSMEVK